MHHIMFISLFPTPFDHFHFHLTFGKDPALILTLHHKNWSKQQNVKCHSAVKQCNALDWILKSSDWSLRDSGQTIFCCNCAEFWQQPTMFLLLFLATGRKKTVFSFFWSTPLCYESHLWNISMNYDCHMVPFSTSLSTDRWSNWYSIQDEETFELSKSELK